jgi:hypothetical protein
MDSREFSPLVGLPCNSQEIQELSNFFDPKPTRTHGMGGAPSSDENPYQKGETNEATESCVALHLLASWTFCTVKEENVEFAPRQDEPAKASVSIACVKRSFRFDLTNAYSCSSNSIPSEVTLHER